MGFSLFWAHHCVCVCLCVRASERTSEREPPPPFFPVRFSPFPFSCVLYPNKASVVMWILWRRLSSNGLLLHHFVMPCGAFLPPISVTFRNWLADAWSLTPQYPAPFPEHLRSSHLPFSFGHKPGWWKSLQDVDETSGIATLSRSFLGRGNKKRKKYQTFARSFPSSKLEEEELEHFSCCWRKQPLETPDGSA